MIYRKKLLINLSVIMILIFILTSAVTIFYEFTHLELHVKNKATTTSKLIANQYLSNKMTMIEEDKKFVENEFFKNLNFYLFKLHDAKNEPLISFQSKQYFEIKENIAQHKHFLSIHEDNNIKILLTHDHVNNIYYIDTKMKWKYQNNKEGSIHSFYDASEDISNIYKEWLTEIIKIGIVCLLILLAIFPVIILLQKDIIHKNQQLSKTNIEILKILGNAIAQRDSDTNTHNYRVTLYSIYLAEELKMSTFEIKNIIQGAFLHDIGKIGISDNILLKNGKLSEKEFAEMKKHVIKGTDIIKDCKLLEPAKDIILYHHEKYDGTGYFKGLKNNEIPISARIFAISDVFDALTSQRPYKKAFEFEKAKYIMIKESEKHFDPKLLELFFQVIPKFYKKIEENNTDEYLSILLHEKVLKYY